MRPEGNPLDLNNLPDDQYPRDHGYNEKEGGEDDRKEECGKVYECRFCSLKFCKSQALGGHMNRHRQEKETEKLNNARQLLLRNDHHNLVSPNALHHLGCCQPIATTGYGNMGFPRTFSGSSSSSTHIPPPSRPSPPPLYASSPSRPVSPFPTHIIPMNDYHVGHVMSSSSHHQQYRHPNMNYLAGAPPVDSSNYTCIGAPVGQARLNWGPSYNSEPQQHRLNPPPNSTINRFQDHGF